MLGRPSAVENQTGEFRQVVGAVERRLPMGALLNSIADPWRPPPPPPLWPFRIPFYPSPHFPPFFTSLHLFLHCVHLVSYNSVRSLVVDLLRDSRVSLFD